MKAIVFTKYGSADVLQYKEVVKPIPKEEEVLVKVYAAAANPLDWRFMRAKPFLARIENGLFKPKNMRLGADIAGKIVEVGSNVTHFKIGDEVFGEKFETGLGGFAEYVSVPEGALAMKPANISFVEAAAVPIAALTALQGLRNEGKIQPGQKVLVNGASGGLGTFAVQISKAIGAEVTGVCSSKNADLVRSIGADSVIDYMNEDFTNNGIGYDLIFDAVGNRSVSDLERALRTNGTCAIAGFTNIARLIEINVNGRRVSRTGRKTIGMMKTVHTNKEDLLYLKELLESKKVVPVIDKCFPLNEAAEALKYLETGRARGKVIITVV
ncbi:NAD(P)-dependent alcohol dehydrogenase [Cytobacillus sp. IB215316]|uniref:NAD(P)-dependent alcohol dehydrogenase n=1 Tax=Cytobacillus sp. IB215316 TaxID=3097354 RepID=UPI002A125131|nr:NAD(P)-dependent alcohol dehydrogenase [Cytobacillus sp. IB215316]MDX8362421.1 NAD(P)-dependent alcohol dehydrogenase [Cytobacillus sp. IB215316]